MRKKFTVVMEVFASTTFDVLAESADDAKEQILDRNPYPPGICSCCGEKVQIDGIGEVRDVFEAVS